MKKIILIFVLAAAGIMLYCNYSKEESEAEVYDGQTTEEDDSFNEPDELDLLADRLYAYAKDRNIDSLATLFFYPISREYPTRDIMSEAEFIERSEEIFDEVFCEKIANNPYNWGAMGWRGYMYDNGDLWVDYGDSLIMSVNVYSQVAEQLHQKSIEKEKSMLHESILVHATEPICAFRTKDGKWYGRIDRISRVDNINVQLAIYESTTPIDCAPDYLMFGLEDIQGTALNIYYEFKGGAFNFEIDNPRIYEEGRYPYTLTIEHHFGQEHEGTFDIDWVYWEDLREEYLAGEE